MYENKLKNVKKIIDADAFKSDILNRTEDMVILNDKDVAEIKIASRCKKGHHARGRK